MRRTKWSDKYWDEMILVVKKLVWSFQKTTGLEFEDLLGEGFVALTDAMQTYNPNKGAMSTWVWSNVKAQLVKYTYKEKQEREKVYTEDLAFQLLLSSKACSILDRAHFLERLSRTSEDTQTVCHMIFSHPEEYYVLPPKLARGKLKRKLREQGWIWSRIWDSFKEIKVALNETIVI